MGHGCRQTLLRAETCTHHVLTETYDKRIITGLKGQEKILLCEGGGGGNGGHYMKNKNTGGYVLSTQPDQQKRPQCKNAQKCHFLFLARFAHSAFYKIHISGAANRHAPVQYAFFF